MWKLAKLKRFFRKFISFFLIFQLSFFQLASFAIPQLVYAQAVSELTASYDATAHELDLALSQNSESEYRVYYQADQLEAVTGNFVAEESIFLGICSGEDCVEDVVNRLVVKVNVDNEVQVQRLELIDDVLNLVDSYTSVSLELDDDEQFWLENKTAQGWQENEDGSYTIDNVELDHVYTAPQNDQVSVTFTQLPADSGNLTIKEVILSEEQVEELNALSNVAFDITSDMEDGSFEYDLMLPIPEGSDDDAQVIFAESMEELSDAKEIETVIEDKQAKVENLDHFTIFVVTTPPALTGQVCVYAGATTSADCYVTIQAAIDAADPGDAIQVKNGTYLLSSTLNVNEEVKIIGESKAGVIIDASGNGTGYGIKISADNVVIKRLTILPPVVAANYGTGSGGGFAIHASNTPNLVTNLTLKNITIDGGNRTGFDLHGVDGGNLKNLTSKNAAYGNGISLTGSSNITLEGIRTENNVWGGIALYNSTNTNPIRPTSNIMLLGSTFTQNEANPLYAQNEFSLTIHDIDAQGFDYVVKNPDFRTDIDASKFVFYQKTLSEAHIFSLGLQTDLIPNTASTIQNIVGDHFYVYETMEIARAINDVLENGTINVAAGTYIEDVEVNKSVTIIGAGPTTIVQPTASANPAFTVSVDDVTIQDLEITHPTILTYGVTLVTGATTGFTLQDVDITNIGAAIATGNGHGIYIYNSFSDLTVTDCFFSSGYQGATSRGIGIFAPNNLTLSDFDISGSTFEYFFVGIYLRSAIDGMDVTTSTFGPFELEDCTAAVAGIYIGDGTDDNFDIENINVTGNTFTDYGRGVYVWNYAANANIDNFEISGNTFTNSIWSSAVRFIIGLNGIEDYSINGDGTGDGINIDDNDFTQGFDIGANVSLIDFRTYDANLLSSKVAVTNNDITFSGAPYTDAMYGIRFFVGGDGFYSTTVSGNVLSGGGTGGAGIPFSTGINLYHKAASNNWAHDLELDISENQITGFDHGVSIYDATNSLYGDLPIGSDININENDLSGNALYGIAYGTGEAVDATNNWWGDATGPFDNDDADGSIPADNLEGLGDSVEGAVTYCPWLDAENGNPFGPCIDKQNPVMDSITYLRNGNPITQAGTAADPVYTQAVNELSYSASFSDDLKLSHHVFVIFKENSSNPGYPSWSDSYCSFAGTNNRSDLTSTTDSISDVNFDKCTSSLIDGQYVVVNQVRDALNKLGESYDLTFVVDNDAPTSNLYIQGDLDEGKDLSHNNGWHGEGWYESFDNVNLLIQTGDTATDKVWYQLLDEDISCPVQGDAGYQSASHDTNIDSEINGKLDGEYSLCYYAQDIAGNTESSVNKEILRKDNAIPSFTIDSVSGNNVSGVYYNGSDTLGIDITIDDPLSGYVRGRYDLYEADQDHNCGNHIVANQDDLASAEQNPTRNLSISGLSDGNYCSRVWVYDDVQNKS